MAGFSRFALSLVLLSACTTSRSADEGFSDAGLAQSAVTAQEQEPDALAVVRETAKTNEKLAYAFAHGGGLTPRDGLLSSPGDRKGDFEHLAARFPLRADGTLQVDVARVARLRIALTPLGVKPVQAKLSGGRAVYEDAFPSTDLVALGNAYYAEHLFVLRDAAAKPSIDYRVDLGKGLHARWEEDTHALVLADAKDEGRMRVLAPYAVDARGVVRAATMTFTGDRLHIALDPTGLAYPIVLDPVVESFVWQKMAPTKSPSARNEVSMAYDSDRKVIVLYGGSTDLTTFTPVAETWEYDGKTWTQRCGAPLAACALPAMGRHATEYDAALKKTWVHGWGDKTITTYLGLWDGSNWTVSSWAYPPPAGVAVGTTNAGSAYDSLRGEIVKQGGGLGFGPIEDTWTWNGSWTHISGSNSCDTADPNCLYAQAMAYHAASDRVVLFGGNYSSSGERFGTWLWNGATKTWTGASPTTIPFARAYARMVYDSARKKNVMFGGSAYMKVFDDTYEWNGTNWFPVTVLTKPAGRSNFAMAYDASRGRSVVFGGQVGAPGSAVLTAETWEYHSRGAACSTGADCDTGTCVDGVCCESTCGTCERCDDTSPGTCTKVISADDPDTCKAPTSTCNPTGACKKLQGQACATGTDCLNGICVDGVCCGTACTGVCQACKASLKADGLNDGTCGAAKAGINPHSDCTSGTGGACGQTGVCDGFGKCALQATGTSCGTGAVCTGTVAKGQQCDGAGTCVTKATGTECAPALCVSGTGCKTTCVTNSDCASSGYCDTSVSPATCKTKKDLGAACTNGSQCSSTFCIDGVCCNSLCNEKCQACSAATKESGSGDGVCGAAKNGLNPHSDCIAGSGGACGQTGTCDGAGSCSLQPSGKSCGTGSVCEGTVAKGQQCDGLGACVNNPTGTDCVPGKCMMGCKLDCTKDGDCDTTGYCDTTAHQCKAKKKNGDACAANSECENPFCVDGVCCNKPCTGQCESCAFAGAEGTCVPVSGDPVGGRPACAAEPAGSCKQTTCDGVDGSTCAGFVGAKVICQAAACTEGKAVGEVHCDGKGNCPADAPKICEPYACGDKACKTSCAGNDDCKSPATCDTATGKCVNAAKCDGDHTLTSADGMTTTDCNPYKCDSSGTCKGACTASSDCVSPAICSGGVCAAPPADDSGSSGGCSTTTRSGRSLGTLALLALAVLFVRKRASA